MSRLLRSAFASLWFSVCTGCFSGSVFAHEAPRSGFTPAETYSLNGLSLHSSWDESLTWVVVIVFFLLLGDGLFSYLRFRKKYTSLEDRISQQTLLLNSIAEGVYGLDLDGNCTFCNAATLRLLGYRREEELVGRNIHSLIHHTHTDGSPYAAADCKACLAYKENQQVHLEDEILWRSDGRSFQAEYWSYPLRKGSRLVGAVVSFLDISERKRMEAKLKEANQELDAFVYTVSHDLRTPISAVIGYADLLKETCGERLNEEEMSLLTTIEWQGNKMALLVEDLLALARAGTLELPSRAVDVNAEVAFVISEFNRDIRQAKMKVKVADLPPVRVPVVLLTQIFENLIGNALRYACEEGGTLEVLGERDGQRVRYAVRDHGPGIPEGERARIFDVFFRGITGKKLVGSGVGLATVQKIAKLYGGQAWVSETPGGGATFWVEMLDTPPDKD